MNATIGWVVAVVVALGAGYYIFFMMPQQEAADTTVPPGEQTSEQAGEPLQEQMSGTWRSSTDPKFTREIRTDGVMIDRYEGEATAGIGGEWSVVNPATEGTLASIAGSLAGKTVIKVVWEGGSETTYFSINELGEDSMSITHLSGAGGVETFTKI